MNNVLPLYNAIKYQKEALGKAVDNYQKMFGVDVEILRVSDRKDDTYIKAYGQSRTVRKNPDKYIKVGVRKILANPSQLYYHYTSGANGELEVNTTYDDLKVGDVIKYIWVDGSVIEYQITELPQTYGDIYFTYKLKGLHSTKATDRTEAKS